MEASSINQDLMLFKSGSDIWWGHFTYVYIEREKILETRSKITIKNPRGPKLVWNQPQGIKI